MVRFMRLHAGPSRHNITKYFVKYEAAIARTLNKVGLTLTLPTSTSYILVIYILSNALQFKVFISNVQIWIENATRQVVLDITKYEH